MRNEKRRAQKAISENASNVEFWKIIIQTISKPKPIWIPRKLWIKIVRMVIK